MFIYTHIRTYIHMYTPSLLRVLLVQDAAGRVHDLAVLLFCYHFCLDIFPRKATR